MKKTYLAPTAQVDSIQQSQMLCTSIQSDLDLKYEGYTPDDFDEDDIR
jgi:hypothetical protein